MSNFQPAYGPQQGRPNAKPWYKKWWVIAIGVVLALGIIGNLTNDVTGTLTPAEEPAPVVETTEAAAPTPAPAPTAITETTVAETSEPAVEEPAPEPDPTTEVAAEPEVPAEHTAALRSAQSYIEFMPFSKAGLFDQLTSEYGEGFPEDAAQYAVDNVGADWNEQALKSAISYREIMSMSNDAIHDQLTSEYGEKFTVEEADYAIANLPS